MIKDKNIEEIKDRLLIDIGEKRLAHSLRVVNTAIELSKKYDLEEKKVFLAGILHDCGRLKNSEDLLKYAKYFDIVLDDTLLYNTQLIHAPLGCRMAKNIYEIYDIEILNSIKYHTTGRENMGLLEKIIFIADYIEPKRNFKGVEDVRRLVKLDLDKSIILAIEQNIKFLIDRDKLIHMDSVKALNYLKLNTMRRGD